MALTERWTTLRRVPAQRALWHAPQRFPVVPAGRRSGKTELAKRRLVMAALRGTAYDRPSFFAAAPTREQAKRIYWSDLKALVPPALIQGRPSESELVIRLVTGAEIHVLGMDKPERVEGSPWDGGILDEYGNMRPDAWELHVRPAMSDRRGWCMFIGVPEGRNHYYELYRRAQADQAARGDAAEWGAYHWTSAQVLPPEEVEAARRDMDPLSFAQEYEGSFVSFQGRAYYQFEVERNAAATLEYQPEAPLVFALDFNISPGVAVVAQEMLLPGGATGTGVIGEVWIPRASNTPAVCDRLLADWGDHAGPVRIYGDATGGAGGTAQTEGSDWEIVERMLRSCFGDRLSMRVPRANGRERARVNAVNTRLCAGDDTVRLYVDPETAPHVVRDLDGVRVLEGGSGELDKKHDKTLTHISDALGYYVAEEFPAVARVFGGTMDWI